MKLLPDTHSFLWFIAGSPNLSPEAQRHIEDTHHQLFLSVASLWEMAIIPFHHRDPFDRLLIAQAHVEQMPIVSGDPAFDAYAIKRLW